MNTPDHDTFKFTAEQMEQLLGPSRDDESRLHTLFDKYTARSLTKKETIEMLVRLRHNAENNRESQFMFNMLCKQLSELTKKDVIKTLKSGPKDT